MPAYAHASAPSNVGERPPADANSHRRGWKLLHIRRVIRRNAAGGRPRYAGAIVRTTASLVGANVATSLLGFAYWGVAARSFATDTVGVAAAAISLMTLLGRIAPLGLGTSLVGELPRHGHGWPALVATALVTAGIGGTLLGLIAIIALPAIAPELTVFSASATLAALFAAGVSLSAVGEVLDQAAIGMLRGGVQLVRNLMFAVSKLVLLIGLSIVSLAATGAGGIYATWVGGQVISVILVAGMAVRTGTTRRALPLAWRSLIALRSVSLQHHVLNLTRFAPTLALPVIVTALLSAHATALFYVALLLAGAIYLISASATFTLFAVGARSPAELAAQLRFTAAMSFATALAGNVFVVVGGGAVLALFGAQYASQALSVLIILSVAAFPISVKDHWIAVQRVRGWIGRAARVTTACALIELAAASGGALVAGLEGLSAGWLIALFAEAALFAPSVVRAATDEAAGAG